MDGTLIVANAFVDLICTSCCAESSVQSDSDLCFEILLTVRGATSFGFRGARKGCLR